MKKIKEYVGYPECELIKQILKNNDIEVIMKSSTHVGSEYFGEGTMYDIYVPENEYNRSLKILEEYKKGGNEGE